MKAADYSENGKSLQSSPGNKRIRLKAALPSAFIILICFTGLLIIFLNYFLSSSSLRYVADNYIVQASKHLQEKTHNHLAAVEQVLKVNSRLLTPGEMGEDYFQSFNKVTVKEVHTFPQIALAYFGDTEGNFWMNARNPDGTISTQHVQRLDDSELSAEVLAQAQKMPRVTEADKAAVAELLTPYVKTSWWHRNVDDYVIKTEEDFSYPYDPRLRPWFINAKVRKTRSWTDAYVFSSSGKLYASGKPGMTVSTPVYRNEQFVGVVGIDIVLEEVSSFLLQNKIGDNGRAFIINSNGSTIALTDYKQVFKKEKSAGLSLNNIEDISDRPVVDGFRQAHELLGTCTYNPLMLDKELLFDFKSGGQKYFGFFAPFPAEYGLDWLLGIVVPEKDFVGQFRRNILISLGVSVFLLLIVVWVAKYFTDEVTNPLKVISDGAGRIRNLELDNPVVTDSIFDEIDQLSGSFSSMQNGLKSFRKYVPHDLVRHLIRSGEEASLGGKSRTATIWFSDVVSFTRIAEAMPPNQLVLHLSDYMEELSRIIIDEQGTVDKYIGDAIMAFWNAPIETPDHALRACRAALSWLKIQKELTVKWKEKGLPVFRSRIGINTGDVVVGNMGAQERLNYTVLGDPVNLASRLEALGKTYGVDIIIGESTYSEAAERIEARRLDRVAVKGKTQGVAIYELVGEKGRVDEESLKFITAYEVALEAYFQRQWRMAFELFKRAYRLRPNDVPVRLFIKRCKLYFHSPPPDDWDGTFVLKRK